MRISGDTKSNMPSDVYSVLIEFEVQLSTLCVARCPDVVLGTYIDPCTAQKWLSEAVSHRVQLDLL